MTATKALDAEFGRRYTPAEIAPYIGRTAKTVRQMCATGDIGCITQKGVGGARRYLISDKQLRAWIAKHST